MLFVAQLQLLAYHLQQVKSLKLSLLFCTRKQENKKKMFFDYKLQWNVLYGQVRQLFESCWRVSENTIDTHY